jgi:hypothetical protein
MRSATCALNGATIKISFAVSALIPRNIANILTTPDYLLFVLVFVVVIQLIVWKAEAFRIFWHSCLEGLGLWKSR